MDGLDSNQTDPNQMGDPNQGPMAQPPVQQPTVQPPSQEPTGPSQTPEAPKSSKGLIITLVIGVIIVALGAFGYYYYVTKIQKQPVATTTPSTPPATSTSTNSSTIQATYSKTTAVQPASDKSKAVNAIFYPVLQKVFNNEVKLSDDMGSMMTYVANRKITATDVTAVETQLQSLGYTAADTSSKQLTMTKTPYTWVITFTPDNDNTATVEITY